MISNEDYFKRAILLTTYSFRFFLAVIIGAFIYEQTHTVWQAFLGVVITLLVVFVDFYHTFVYHHGIWAKRAALIFKLALILISTAYAVQIWFMAHNWLYTVFGLFVAFLFGMDFILTEQKTKDKIGTIDIPTDLNKTTL